MSVAFTELRAAGVTTKSACALIGRPRATHYRKLLGPVLGPKPRRNVPNNGQALTPAERDAVLALINTKQYADLSIGQVWTRELDEGRYLCVRCRRCTGSPELLVRAVNGAGRRRIRRR